jgi:hypothetical protein
MKEEHPDDILYEYILADLYFAEGKFKEAVTLASEVVRRDPDNSNIEDSSQLLHRAFCLQCSARIIGRRHKCKRPECSEYDWCTTCFEVKGEVVNACSHEERSEIPSNLVAGLRSLWERRSGGSSGRSPIVTPIAVSGRLKGTLKVRV